MKSVSHRINAWLSSFFHIARSGVDDSQPDTYNDSAKTSTPKKLLGNIDFVQHDRVMGWAADPDQPGRVLRLEILVDDIVVAQVEANTYRSDIERAGIGDGHKGFDCRLTAPMTSTHRHIVLVRCLESGQNLGGSPKLLEPKVEPDAQKVIPKPAAKLRGHVDAIRHNFISGWAHDPEQGESPVKLRVTANNRLIGQVLANRYRADLEKAGFGNGNKSFSLPIVPSLSPLIQQVVEVRREEDGVHLPGSPYVLMPEGDFDAEVQSWRAQVLADSDDEAALEKRRHVLSAQLELVLQLLADQRGRRIQRDFSRHGSAETEQISPRAIDSHLPRRLRALVIDVQIPVTGRDAGSNAILSHVRSLQRLGFDVSFASPAMKFDSGVNTAVDGLHYCMPPWYNSVEEVLRYQANCFDLVYLHRVTIADRYTALIRAHQSQALLVYSVADLHHLRVRRQAQVKRSSELAREANQLQAMEKLAINRSDRVITYSLYEAELLRRQVPQANVHVVPWAVSANPTKVPFSKRRGVAFVGGYGHAPNVDAAQWLITEIVPLLRTFDPEFECLLVGSEMPEPLKLPRPGIVPIGRVDNLADIFDRVRLTVAPLSYGAGIKGKVLDSLAAGVPCVCTSIAAEGLQLPETLLNYVADDAQSIAAAIWLLHEDAELNRIASDLGVAYISEHMSEQQIDKLMRSAVNLTG
jgi:glycosyltransferase involved in cell wall biosynthesis